MWKKELLGGSIYPLWVRMDLRMDNPMEAHVTVYHADGCEKKARAEPLIFSVQSKN